MNERIRELALQAEEYADTIVDEGGDFHPAYTKKFAESIIKKCLEQCYFRGMNDELYAGQLKAAAYIEEYFGVEE